MALLILTREGLNEIMRSGAPLDWPLYLNPAAASREELEQLGAQDSASGLLRQVRFLPRAIDPADERSVHEMAQFAETDSGRRIWTEAMADHAGGAPDAAGKDASGLPARQDSLAAPLHLASQAGRAIRNLAQSIRIGDISGFDDRRLLIVPYLGLGNAHRLSLRGRVLEEKAFRRAAREDNGWENLVALYERLESDQVGGARVQARFGDLLQESVTDRGGYFALEFELPAPLDKAGWHTVELELLDPLPAEDQTPVRAQGSVLVPPATARFGVISDIDDTILWTNVTNKVNMMLMLARTNAHTRKPFKGVAAFYRALQAGQGGSENNPVFYVSSSPWHLYTPLLEFLQKQDIPLGPLMLKELSIRKLFGAGRHRNHKIAQIEAIIAMYPQLQFVLIGDSGEQDPEIYAEIVRRHPQVVKVIYIRNINPDPARIEAIDRLIEEVRPTGTQLILAADSEFAAAHAASEGLIRTPAVAEVRQEKEAEQAEGIDIDDVVNEKGARDID